MVTRRPLSAHARFAVLAKARAIRRARRARRARIAVLLCAPFALNSCVDMGRPEVATALPTYRPSAELGGFRATIVPAPMPALAPDAPITGPSFLAQIGQRDRMRATLCLASAIYYEAATEPDEGQRAVAQVVLNRVRHTGWPATVCGVVYQGSDQPGCQFSFACDGAMARNPMLSAWIRARRVAEQALAGSTYAPVGSATFYHTLQVAPAWRLRVVPVGVVGAHIFYRLPQDGADAASLPARYAGGEPTPGPLPRVAAPADLLRVSAASAAFQPAQSMVVPTMPAVRQQSAAVAPSEDKRYVPGALPDSDVLPQYRDSGKWIAPAR